jgi:O-antigen ligase
VGISFALSLISGFYKMIFSGDSINTIYITYNHLVGLFGVQPIYLSLFYLLAILFCVNLIRLNNCYWKGYLALSIILFIGIILLSSRTILAISVIVISFKFLFFKSMKIRDLLYVFSIVILGLILTFSIPTLRNRVIQFNQNVSSYSGSSFRVKVWKNAINIFKDSPVYGYGFNKSQEVLMKQYQTTNFRRAYINNFNAHNQYLQSLIDSGIIGLLTLILMILAPLFKATKNNQDYLFFLLIIVVILIPESFFLRQNGIIFYCFFNMFFYLSNKERLIRESSKLYKT